MTEQATNTIVILLFVIPIGICLWVGCIMLIKIMIDGWKGDR